MPALRFAKSFRSRLPGIATSTTLSRMAWAPSYRAPRAVDVLHPSHDIFPTHATWADVGAKDVATENGRVEPLSLSGRSFIALAGPLVESNPPREIRLVAVKWYLDELAACAHLSRVERLNLAGNRIGPEGLRLLAGSPHLAAIHLDLSTNNLGSDGLAALLSAPWRHQLRGLNLARNGLDPNDLRNLLAELPGLVDLDLAGNPIGPNAIDVLAKRGRWTRLRLSETGLEADGLAALVSLDELDISFNALGNRVLDQLPRVRVLSLRGNRLTRLDGLSLADIESLDLGVNAFGDEALLALAAEPGWESLRHLDLTNTWITHSSVQPLHASGRFRGLDRLCLDWNPAVDTFESPR
ncbi:MAG TPA: hypothetical protein VGJ05_16835 [Fimbriiglobus sp.]